MSIERKTAADPISQSADIVADNLDKLKQLFPSVFTEGNIDFEAFRELLGDKVETDPEYYRFTWPGKAMAKEEARKPSRGTLRPAKDESVNWDTTENLYIEGDNLEVLKLLQKSYANKVKMIYIDPPYNTGKDFVYKDNYKDNLASYNKKFNRTDEDGNLLSSAAETNQEGSARYHSNWLNMMYPRLTLARNLLTEDGVIFISIGVEEFSNLKTLCNMIFGEDNFVEIFSWTKTSTPPALSTKSRKTNEYILCFEKNKSSTKYNGEPLDGGDQPLLNSGNKIRTLKFPKEFVYFKEDKFSNGILKKGKPDRVELLEDIEIVDGYSTTDFSLKGEFKWTQEFLDEEIQKNTTLIIKSSIFSIRFIRDEEGFKRPTNFIKNKYTSPLINKKTEGVGTNENASSYLKSLMNADIFSYPKPLSLIEYLTNFICKDDDIVLDFFSGSSTTADAIFNYNLKNQTHLRNIQVQLPEILDLSNGLDKNERQRIQNGIDFLTELDKKLTVSELGKERIRRAGKKILDETPELKDKLDIGFKVFKLDESNIKTWETNPEKLDENLFLEDVIKTDRTEEDVLYEILLKYGLDLTLPIQEKEIDKQKLYAIGGGALLVYLGDNANTEISQQIINWAKELDAVNPQVVFKDNGFNNSQDKVNTIQLLKSNKITDVWSI